MTQDELTQDEFSEQIVTLFNQLHGANGFDVEFAELMYMKGQQTGPEQASFTLIFNIGKKELVQLDPKKVANEVAEWANETMRNQ